MRNLLKILLPLAMLAPQIAHAQLETRPTPMWEGVEKSDADKANDEKLVKDVLKLTKGDRTQAATVIVRLGWDEIAGGRPNEAVRRFNQAWLIKPDMADIFWGYAVATHIRGDDLDKVERWFDEAGKTITDNPRLLSDRGRVLEERKEPGKARSWFEKALVLDPEYVPAHVGMVLVARALEDEALEEKHQKLHDEFTKEN